jgi:hypothetical protein
LDDVLYKPFDLVLFMVALPSINLVWF